MRLHRLDRDWQSSLARPPQVPRSVAYALFPLIALWTLPQTLAGLAIAMYRRAEGHPLYLYQFGPFLFLVARTPGPASAGISLGVVVFSEAPSILKHEFCHLFSGLWLSWFYLPVYGLEYLILGHSRSFHERITCFIEEKLPWGWRFLG